MTRAWRWLAAAVILAVNLAIGAAVAIEPWTTGRVLASMLAWGGFCYCAQLRGRVCWPWHHHDEDEVVMRERTADFSGSLPLVQRVPGGFRVTVISPDSSRAIGLTFSDDVAHELAGRLHEGLYG